MDRQDTTKVVVLEVSSVTASRGNRRQPEKSEREKQSEQRERRRLRPRRSRAKQPQGQEVNRTLFPMQPPEPRLKPVSIRQLKPRQIGGQPPSPTNPHLPSFRPGSQTSNQPLKPRMVRKVVLPPPSGTGRGGNGRTRLNPPAFQPFAPRTDSRPRRPEQASARIAPPPSSSQSPGGRTPARRDRQSPSAQTPPSQRNRVARRPQKRSVSPLVHIFRLLILGVGMGAIVGTLLSALDPTTHASVKTTDLAKQETQQSPNGNMATSLPLGQEIAPLKAQLQTLVSQNSTLQPGIFIIDDTGAYLDWEGSSNVAAASTIKVPILVAFLQDVDAGQLRLDEMLTLQPEMIAAGSGNMQYQKPGTQFTALEVATKMISISDNTATNMIIARLGGAEALNQRFRSWGLTLTTIRNPLPDIEGTNTTSPKELAQLLSMVNRGELMSLHSRDRMLYIMQQTETNTLLPQGLGAGATIAHKTGNIGELLGDVGLVDMPTGKRYIVAVLVKRPRNDA
ncbi:MAG: serine hydrolase, partial [Coleofasciculus sp. S288]|nr:serine hydrolase [Coleofasciculus sp. S288]